MDKKDFLEDEIPSAGGSPPDGGLLTGEGGKRAPGGIVKNLRLIVQCCFTALTNGYVFGYLKGGIYRGKLKNLCIPGLSCYSCPGAFGSCPIGSLQAVLDTPTFRVSCYVFGFLMAFGSLMGRFVCGWLCPFGLVQDLLYRIPLTGGPSRPKGPLDISDAKAPSFASTPSDSRNTDTKGIIGAKGIIDAKEKTDTKGNTDTKASPSRRFLSKRKNLPGHSYLIYLKYVILILFVILLPSLVVDDYGMGKPWFCQYICPSGTLFAGIPQVIANKSLRMAIGGLFFWKLFILIVVVCLSIFFARPFCKYICPLGAFYGLFNPVSILGLSVDAATCTKCGSCRRACNMDIKVWEKPNSPECIRCGDCVKACPEGAICAGRAGGSGLKDNQEKQEGKRAHHGEV